MHAQGKSLSTEHANRRILPAWMHHFYCRLKDSITDPDVSSWRTCPRCYHGFGIHELRGRIPICAHESPTSFPRLLCPLCCVLAEKSSNPYHVCAKCGFRSLGLHDFLCHMTDDQGCSASVSPKPRPTVCPVCGFQAATPAQLGEHMEIIHHVTHLKIPKSDKVPSADRVERVDRAPS
jgi:hypothetical protein